MTSKERASKLAKDMVRAYEVGATMKDLDAAVHFWTNLAEKAIEDAIRQAKAEQASVTAKAEREECLKILQKAYQEWFDGDYGPGEAFESAKDRIRSRNDCGYPP